MINTYNETKLHKTLKKLYALNCDGTTEANVGTYICDVVSDKTIYEIQTSNLSSLLKKITFLLEKNYTVHVIFPIPEETIIEMRNTENKILYSRKSPKKDNIFRIFKEITKLYNLLNNINFDITVLMISQKDIRIKMDKPVQINNKTRKWKKDWIKEDKELLNINSELKLSCTNDYKKLVTDFLPSPEKFCVKDFTNLKISLQYAKLTIWILKKLNMIEELNNNKKLKYYKFI